MILNQSENNKNSHQENQKLQDKNNIMNNKRLSEDNIDSIGILDQGTTAIGDQDIVKAPKVMLRNLLISLFLLFCVGGLIGVTYFLHIKTIDQNQLQNSVFGQIYQLNNQIFVGIYNKSIDLGNVPIKQFGIANNNLPLNLTESFVPRILNLSFQGCSFSQFSYNNITELKYLNLTDNLQLTTFNNNNLTSLIQLNLSNTKVSSFINNSLPILSRLIMINASLSSFGPFSFTNLLVLDLSNNQLASLNVNNSFPKLQSLILNNNFLSSIDGINLSLKSLIQLSLVKNKINSLTSYNNNYSLLNSLDVSQNGLNNFNNNNFSSLTKLNLSSNSLTTFINNTLPMCVILDLSNNSLNTLDTTNVINQINQLYLNSNYLNDNIAEILVSFNFTSIQTINLQNNTSIKNASAAAQILTSFYPNAVILL